MDADCPIAASTEAHAAAGQPHLDLHLLQAGQMADRATIKTLEDELAICRADLAGARGEAAGLLAATTMTERACTALRQELVNTTRAVVAAEAALQHMRDAPAAAPPPTPPQPVPTTVAADDRIAQLQQELHAAQAEAAAAHARIHAIGRSTSWRLTGPLRAAIRLLRGEF